MPPLTLTTENVLGKVEIPLLRRWYVYTANKEVGTYLMLLTDTHFDNDKLLYLAKSEPGANLSNMSHK